MDLSVFVVTGGAGFIGSNVIHRLVEMGHEIRCIDNESTGTPSNLEEVANRIDYSVANICDADFMRDVVRGADYVIHLAAAASVVDSIEDPIGSCRNNIEGTISVFEAARACGVRRVVSASSAAIYGDQDVSPVHEDLPRDPLSPYAITKATLEDYARAYTRLHGMDLVSLRFFNVFGPRQRMNTAYASVIPAFAKRLLNGESPVVHGDGLQTRDFVYVRDVADAVIRSCTIEGDLAGEYNIGCGDSVSIIDLANTMIALAEFDGEPIHEGKRQGDIRHSLASIDRARAALDYAPSVTWEEGLAETVAWYRANAEALA